MKKGYQTTNRRAGTSGRTTPKKAKVDPQRAIHEAAVTLPEAVTVAVGELPKSSKRACWPSPSGPG